MYTNGSAINLYDDTSIGKANEGNMASLNGGGVYISGCVVMEMAPSARIHSNSAIRGVGVFMLNNDSQSSITNGSIDQNTTVANPAAVGGGLYIIAGTANAQLSLIAVSLISNESTNGAGIAYNSNTFGGSLLINDSFITANIATLDGSGLHIFGNQKLTAFSSLGTEIISNSAGENGGGVRLLNGASLTAHHGTFDLNDASVSNPFGRGGGIFVDATQIQTTVTLDENSSISSNQAYRGGGVYMVGMSNSYSNLNILKSSLIGNSSTNGGALFSNFSSIILANTLITNNTAIEEGAVISGFSIDDIITNTLSYYSA